MNYFKQNRCMALATNISVSVQLGWFKKLKPSLCKYKEGFYKFFFNNTKCDNYFKKSLFLVVEIGGNDTNALISYKNISKLQEGAIEVVVLGNFPIGCNFGVLTIVNSGNKDDYDQYGCLVAYNTFIEYYNGHLNQAIETLR
ncbi:GDSL esterase/lipase [Glycine max]|nr:GDSL esterase/lipase [Glycine max]